MAVKVVYDATRGLVQENDATGVGGFQIKDVSLTEGSETVAATQAGAAASALGVTLGTTTAAGDILLIAAGSSVGQQKTVIYKTENAVGDSLVLKNAAGDVTFATLDEQGDVAVLVWDGAIWRVVNLAT